MNLTVVKLYLTCLLIHKCSYRWLGLLGQIRPKKLISNIRAEIQLVEEWDMTAAKDIAVHFLEKSMYSIGLLCQIAVTSSTSLLLTTEKHVERTGSTQKFLLYHQAITITLLYLVPLIF